jgi:hypothetical protein
MAAPKGNKKIRIDKITSYLELAGPYRIPESMKEEFSKKFGVSKRQISLDIAEILDKAITPKIEKIKNQFAMSLNTNMSSSHELLLNTDPEIKARGIASLNRTIQTYTEFLERFGIKDPATQRHQIMGNVNEFQLITKTIKEIKNAKKNKKIGDKSKARGDLKSPGK